VKMLSMQHAVQATERRDKDIAKELREIMDCRPEMTPDMRIHMKLLIAQLNGEKVLR